MKSKFKIDNYLNEIFLIIVGILLIIFPNFILTGIIISIGLYLIIKYAINLSQKYKIFSKFDIILNSSLIIIGLFMVLFPNFIVDLTSLFFIIYLLSQILIEIYHILIYKNTNKSYTGNIILLSLYALAIILLLIFYKEVSTFIVVLLGLMLIFSQIIKIINKYSKSQNKEKNNKEYIDTEIID